MDDDVKGVSAPIVNTTMFQIHTYMNAIVSGVTSTLAAYSFAHGESVGWWFLAVAISMVGAFIITCIEYSNALRKNA